MGTPQDRVPRRRTLADILEIPTPAQKWLGVRPRDWLPDELDTTRPIVVDRRIPERPGIVSLSDPYAEPGTPLDRDRWQYRETGILPPPRREPKPPTRQPRSDLTVDESQRTGEGMRRSALGELLQTPTAEERAIARGDYEAYRQRVTETREQRVQSARASLESRAGSEAKKAKTGLATLDP